jgi:hypothetical protein
MYTAYPRSSRFSLQFSQCPLAQQIRPSWAQSATFLRPFSTAEKHTSMFSLPRKTRQPKRRRQLFEHSNVHLLGILRCISFSRLSAHTCHGTYLCPRWKLGYGILPIIALSSGVSFSRGRGTQTMYDETTYIALSYSEKNCR